MQMKTYKHIIFTRFDTFSAARFDDNWLKYRLEIFKKYTLQSILHQDVDNLALWIRYNIHFKAEVQELNNYLKTLQLPCFFTYYKDGVDYETDELFDYVKDSDLVIETRIDSDDMYHKTAMSEIQSFDIDENQIYTFQDGYLYRESTNQLYNYKGSCAPFYTCVYPTSAFIDRALKQEYYPFLPDASKFPALKLLSDNKYIVVVHDKNDSSYTVDWVKSNNLQSGSFAKVSGDDIIKKNKQEILNEFKKWN